MSDLTLYLNAKRQLVQYPKMRSANDTHTMNKSGSEDINRMTRIPILTLAVSFLVTTLGKGDEIITDRSPSPDHKMVLETQILTKPTWVSSQIDVTLTEAAKVVFHTTVPKEKEGRATEVSWAPSSKAALVAINFKAYEDWILLRLENNEVSSTYFDGGELVGDKMLDVLPFREGIKSCAPVARVAWNTVRWIDPDQCSMIYIFS